MSGIIKKEIISKDHENVVKLNKRQVAELRLGKILNWPNPKEVFVIFIQFFLFILGSQ